MRANEAPSAAFAATLCAGALLAHQVAANAVRDALFLSSYDVTFLPRIVVVAAVFSVFVVMGTSRLLVRFSPARFVPFAFVASAAALVGEWVLLRRSAGVAAIVFYLHTIAFGSVLTSGFWSLVNERFDPRSAKRLIGRIASGGTAGAIIGGICAERIGAKASVEVMFFFLAFLHLFCAWTVRGIGTQSAGAVRRKPTKAPRNGLAVLTSSKYLQSIALLVILVTMSAALLDYVLKARAAAAYDSGESLMRFFAAFYAGLGCISFVVQTAASGKALEKLGLGRTAAVLPIGVIVGSIAAVLMPGLISAAAARAMDRVGRTSLYRSAYELLYTPLPPAEKRATKSIIDVLCDRFGDAAGGALVSVVLAVVALHAERVLLSIVIVFAAAAVFVALRLQRGYVDALEKSLVSMRDEVTPTPAGPQTIALDRIVHRTEMLMFDREQGTFLPNEPEHLLAGVGLSLDLSASRITRLDLSEEGEAATRAADLASRIPERVKRGLAEPLDPEHVGQVIPLLAWDDVFREVLRALIKTVDRDVEVLGAALLDKDTDFAVRRRIPRVLARATEQRAADLLTHGLGDPRFEVRFQVGRALTRMKRTASIQIHEHAITTALRREAGLGRDVWESQRLLDERGDDDTGESNKDLAERILADRASRSMEHVFRLLSLILPDAPLEVAFQGLQTDDATLRGTALEYLDSVLMPELKAELWPFLDADEAWTPSKDRDTDAVVDRLMKSRPSILAKLEALESND